LTRRVDVLGVEIDLASLDSAIGVIDQRISNGEQVVACFANVHVIEAARRNTQLLDALAQADFVFADGAPVAWLARALYRLDCRRVAGAEIFESVNELAGRRGYSIFLLGSTTETLQALQARLATDSPSLRVAGAISPSFRPQTEDETAELIAQVNASGADILWVGLGAPKQEIWMFANRASLNASFIGGVGAVFDFASGRKMRAPKILQQMGLEWLFRFALEPRRLWRRYLFTNTEFLVRAARALVSRRRANRTSRGGADPERQSGNDNG
jgi:N-acetylglucosaminyldiphosphoundecaprenol N-acetyl-beta-D-mannosaminyltransferase